MQRTTNRNYAKLTSAVYMTHTAASSGTDTVTGSPVAEAVTCK